MASAKLFHELSVAAEISYDRMQSCAEANVGCQDWQRDRVITFYRYAGQWLAYHNALLGVITQGLKRYRYQRCRTGQRCRRHWSVGTGKGLLSRCGEWLPGDKLKCGRESYGFLQGQA